MTNEFLPICDNLFNVISLAAYFCDCVFDIVLCYALLERGRINFFVAVLLIISGSLIVSQVVSVKWYLQRQNQKKSPAITSDEPLAELTSSSPTTKLRKYSIIGLHCVQLGIFWRYAKLFVPVNLRYVKHDVRDLCILRLIHGFCEAAPMLLIQSYILMTLNSSDDTNINSIKIKTLGGQLSTHLIQQSTIVLQHQQKTFKDLNTISASLSLFSLCWSLASFSKNVRIHNVHRLVLTWLGVIFQFFWRFGTVTARVLSLTAYASVYKKWIFLVLILHWISMFLWLISPKNTFHGEQISKLKKIALAFIYIFAYLNLQEINHKEKMIIFYIVMFLENCLLVSLWTVGIWAERSPDWYTVPLYVMAFFFGGIFIMIIYYRYFHIRRLTYDFQTDASDKSNKCLSFSNVCQCNDIVESDAITFHEKKEKGYNDNGCSEDRGEARRYYHHGATNEYLKGIFNCRFSNPVNNATKRKKKKPTSFVPPPTLNIPGNINTTKTSSEVIREGMQSQMSNNVSGPMTIPFWRQPLPTRNSLAGGSSETEGSVASSRINIQLKLQEKKQKQLAELKIIEEEIKQGKLCRHKVSSENEDCSGRVSLLPRQPAPRAKKHIDFETLNFRRNSSSSETDNMNLLLYQQLQKNEKIIYNKFSDRNGGISAALTTFSHEMHSDLNNGEKTATNFSTKQPSGSSTLTSTTSENEKNSLKRHVFTSRRKLLHSMGKNVTGPQSRVSPRIGSPSCHYDPRTSSYNSLESKNKSETNRTSNQIENNGNISNVNNNSMDKDKNLASKIIKRQKVRANTPEILLAPNHLDSHFYCATNLSGRTALCDGVVNTFVNDYITSNGCERVIKLIGDDDESSQNAASDIDSHMSLPRSYTLPREFKFNRQCRKPIKSEHFVASTNSSDGDVDSCDDNDCTSNDYDKVSSNQRLKHPHRNNLNKNRMHINSPFSNLNPNIVTSNNFQNSFGNNIKINNLDLINEISSIRYDIAPNSRLSRSKIFNQKTFIRHETKL